jgi:4'-phosphopantetheinyl transferase
VRELPTERVDVWIVPLGVGFDYAQSQRELLSADERARADRFAFEKDRRRFVVGRGALRRILASYVGGRPDEIRFAYGEHGKPMLANSSEVEGIQFNASGSGDLAVCAVTIGKRLGIDIELCRPIADEVFVEQCLAPEERDAYFALSSDQRPAFFYRIWTLKEAYLKATGVGLSVPMSAVAVSCFSGESVRYVADAGATDGGANWTSVEFEPGPNYVGALVVAGQGRPIQYGHWPF